MPTPRETILTALHARLSALPAIALPDLDGKIVELAGIAPGRPLLVNVWASWCGPCVKEMPELEGFSREQAGNGRLAGSGEKR